MASWQATPQAKPSQHIIIVPTPMGVCIYTSRCVLELQASHSFLYVHVKIHVELACKTTLLYIHVQLAVEEFVTGLKANQPILAEEDASMKITIKCLARTASPAMLGILLVHREYSGQKAM